MPLTLATAFVKKQTEYREALAKARVKDAGTDLVPVDASFENLLPGVTVQKPAPKPVASPTADAAVSTDTPVLEAALKPAN